MNSLRPHRSDPAPATIEATPQAIEVIAIRLATMAMLVPRSRDMSNRNGARVVPLHEAANIPRHAAANSAHGIGGVPGSTTGSAFECDDMQQA